MLDKIKNMEHIEEWHKLGDRLSSHLRICNCQRKIKSITNVLLNIKAKIDNREDDYTPEEYLILALLDKTSLITHGINMEYPMLNDDDTWKWIESIKDDPNLTDN